MKVLPFIYWDDEKPFAENIDLAFPTWRNLEPGSAVNEKNNNYGKDQASSLSLYIWQFLVEEWIIYMNLVR